MRTSASPRGSPRIRLISSIAMLALVLGGASFYSIRQTGQLFSIGVKAHVHCAIEAAGPLQTERAEMLKGLGVQFAPMLQPLLNAAGPDYAVVSARYCTVAGRGSIAIVLRRGQTLVSVILTLRGRQEVFPRVLAARVVTVAGIPVHEGDREGYAVAAFDSGPFLVYIVSALPDRQNGELAGHLAPVIGRFTKS